MNTLEFRLDGTKINGENEASCEYPGVHLIKYNTRVLLSRLQVLYPLLFLFNYNMALLSVIFPIYFCPVQLKF